VKENSKRTIQLEHNVNILENVDAN
jgi:hypothetical protein